jgi:transcriptional regulator with XRE-family HTH domain
VVASNKKKELGKKIKIRREKENLSLRQAALECEISHTSLNDIERGVIFPSEATFLRLVETLKFPDRAEVCDLYGKLKGTAPPDVIDFLTRNKAAVDEVRQLINKEKEVENI